MSFAYNYKKIAIFVEDMLHSIIKKIENASHSLTYAKRKNSV